MIVEGSSMAPTYNAGDWLMGRWADYKPGRRIIGRLKVGDVVVIERDEQPGIFYVKRIAEIRGAEVFLKSDNPDGTDSRTWGWIPFHSVRARIEFRVKRAR
jgi:phage repressor protein C with HTH and peptisase S24 domain